MTEREIIQLAKELGWNIEHAETNRRLVEFAQTVLAQFAVTYLKETAKEKQ